MQVPGEGWTGRKPSERYKEGHGGLTGPSGDRSVEGVNGVPGSPPPHCPPWELGTQHHYLLYRVPKGIRQERGRGIRIEYLKFQCQGH